MLPPVADHVPIYVRSFRKNMAHASCGCKQYALIKMGGQKTEMILFFLVRFEDMKVEIKMLIILSCSSYFF